MNLSNLSKPLKAEDIEFRVQSINKGGYATLLAYKNARIDMYILDTNIGRGFWRREHFIINNSLYCRVSIFNRELNQWVSMEDVGTPSKEEKEKGAASDSFKRACTNWGIGRELYFYPEIKISLNKDEYELIKDKYDNNKVRAKPTYKFNLKSWKWFSQFDDKNTITYLGAKDTSGNIRFQFGILKNDLQKDTLYWIGKTHSEEIEPPKKDERKKVPADKFNEVAKWAINNDKSVKDCEKHYILTQSQKKEIEGIIENNLNKISL